MSSRRGYKLTSLNSLLSATAGWKRRESGRTDNENIISSRQFNILTKTGEPWKCRQPPYVSVLYSDMTIRSLCERPRWETHALAERFHRLLKTHLFTVYWSTQRTRGCTRMQNFLLLTTCRTMTQGHFELSVARLHFLFFSSPLTAKNKPF